MQRALRRPSCVTQEKEVYGHLHYVDHKNIEIIVLQPIDVDRCYPEGHWAGNCRAGWRQTHALQACRGQQGLLAQDQGAALSIEPVLHDLLGASSPSPQDY